MFAYMDIYLYSMMYVLVTQFGVVHKNSTWYNTWVDHVEDFFDDSLFKYERWELTRTLGGWKFKDLFLKRIQNKIFNVIFIVIFVLKEVLYYDYTIHSM